MEPEIATLDHRHFPVNAVPLPDEEGVIRAYLVPVMLNPDGRPGQLIRVGQQYYIVAYIMHT